jgi:hypothetical protein
MPIALKSGSLKLLEPSGSVQTCNGAALPFTYIASRLRMCRATSLKVYSLPHDFTVEARVAQMFQKTSSHFKVLGIRILR